MAMELHDVSVSKVGYVGTSDFVVPAGKSLKIETIPEGEEILAFEFPGEKSWRVQVNLEITETDA